MNERVVAKNDLGENDFIIRHNFDAKMKRILFKLGAPRSVFMRSNKSVNLDESTVRIEAELRGTNLRKISVAKQLKDFQKIWENPLWGNYLLVISSFPTDIKAGYVGLALMARAYQSFIRKKKINKILVKQSSPIWHNLYGGFKDSLLDSDLIHPSMLVLNNVPEDMTQVKMEKLRDILVKYDDIPRIVLTTACDPITFMLGKLRHSCSAVLYLGPDDKTLV